MIYAAVRARSAAYDHAEPFSEAATAPAMGRPGQWHADTEAVMGVPQGDHVIAGAGVPSSATQRTATIAYKLGATGKLADTVGSSPTSRMLAVVDAALAAAQPAAASATHNQPSVAPCEAGLRLTSGRAAAKLSTGPSRARDAAGA